MVGGGTLKTRAVGLKDDLTKIMRSFGRTCRGNGKVLVKLVRQTEQQLLEVGHQVAPLAVAAQVYLQQVRPLTEAQKTRLDQHLHVAIRAHEKIEKQSRRLVGGKAVGHCKIVNAYDPTIAPILKGKSNCPAQFGRKSGIIAEMATGFIFAFHLPEGNPVDASYVLPLVDKVEQAIAKPDGSDPRQHPMIHSVAGDLGLNDGPVRATLHRLGIVTVGIPDSLLPLPKVPTKEQVEHALQNPDLNDQATATQVAIAYTCGYSRPFVESLIEGLLSRGGGQIKYKGHRGAIIQTGMTIMATNAATLVRIGQNRLTTRAQKFSHLFRLEPPNPKIDNALKN